MLKINQYFDGKVASVSFQGDELPATVGVMAPGDYQFGTSQHEVLTILSGDVQVLLPNVSEWQRFTAGSQFEVAANASFQLKVLRDTAYLCTYA